MKTRWIVVISVFALLCLGAQTIKFFTDYPNATPVDTDFFVYQRNQSYGNASGSQMKSYFWSNPQFSGNGSISGAFGIGGFSTVGGNLIVNGTYYGNGGGLSNIATAIYLQKTNDTGSGETFVGPTTFVGTGNGVLLGTGTYLFDHITNAVAWWSTDGSLSNALIGAGLQLANGVISATASSTNSSTTATNMFTYNTNADGYVIVTNALQALNVTAPAIASFDAAKQLTNAGLSARFSLTANVLDIAPASIPNGDLQNSQITVNGTANQVTVSASPISLGGSTTLAVANPLLAPGPIATSGFTNSNDSASQFKVTDANKGEQTTLDGRPLIYSDTNSISQCFTWGGPSNTVPTDQGFHFYTTTTPFSFTNMNAVSGSNLWSTICVSNQTANSITGWCTIPGIRIYGVPAAGAASNAVIVPSGKTLIASFWSISTMITNAAIAAQSN